jgi:hypothetical protein
MPLIAGCGVRVDFPHLSHMRESPESVEKLYDVISENAFVALASSSSPAAAAAAYQEVRYT